MRRTTGLIILLLLFAVTAAPPATGTVVEGPGLEFIGEVTFPTGYTFDGVEVGGLSSIAYDQRTQTYFAISDDRSQLGDARWYTIDVDVQDGSLDPGDVVFVDQTTLLQADGTPYPELSLDPEGLGLTKRGTVVITSEGDANALIAPFVNEYNRAGELLREWVVPDRYLPTADQSSGIRQNLAFESMTLTPNGRYAVTATEAALFQDGPAASLTESSPARMLVYNTRTGLPVAEFVYEVGPIPNEPDPPDAFAVNGLVELLALDNHGTMLAMERAFSVGVGNSVQIYLVEPDGDEVSGLDALAGLDVDPVSKTLLLDLEDLGLVLDNLEGMTLGPRLGDGRRLLLMVSDNNFNPNGQFTQFLAFAISR